jgi:hypothetical protein
MIKEGMISTPNNVTSMDILKKMSDHLFYVCTGVSDYSTYKQRIGFDSANVVHVLVSITTLIVSISPVPPS